LLVRYNYALTSLCGLYNINHSDSSYSYFSISGNSSLSMATAHAFLTQLRNNGITSTIDISENDGTSHVFCDNDEDDVHDHIDNCPNNFNPEQEDVDSDDTGDACDADTVYGMITGALPGLKVELVNVTCGSESVYDSARTDSEGYFALGSIPYGRYLVLPKSLYVDFDPIYGLIQIPQTGVQAYDFTVTTE